MQPEATQKLELLRSDFAEVTGRPFEHFFCPVLFKDEDSPLCCAHIVNAAFPSSSQRWTLQRQDVDNFYGWAFESDFVDLRHGQVGVAAEAFVDPTLYKRLRPKILLDGIEVEHFVFKGRGPKQFAQMAFTHGGRGVRLALKISPSEFALKANNEWRVEVVKDIRLAAIVSVLKAAHLTLFEMLGYRYALCGGGRYLGEVPGRFFLENVGRPKGEVLKHAGSYFKPLATMVRPVGPDSPKPEGSINDSSIRVCWCEGSNTPWGGIVFVRARDRVHAALVPVFTDAEGAGRWERFMGSSVDTMETSIARFEKDHWSVSRHRATQHWPAASLD